MTFAEEVLYLINIINQQASNLLGWRFKMPTQNVVMVGTFAKDANDHFVDDVKKIVNDDTTSNEEKATEIVDEVNEWKGTTPVDLNDNQE